MSLQKIVHYSNIHIQEDLNSWLGCLERNFGFYQSEHQREHAKSQKKKVVLRERNRQLRFWAGGVGLWHTILISERSLMPPTYSLPFCGIYIYYRIYLGWSCIRGWNPQGTRWYNRQIRAVTLVFVRPEVRCFPCTWVYVSSTGNAICHIRCGLLFED
jgi:hypothetical protein